MRSYQGMFYSINGPVPKISWPKGIRHFLLIFHSNYMLVKLVYIYVRNHGLKHQWLLEWAIEMQNPKFHKDPDGSSGWMNPCFDTFSKKLYKLFNLTLHKGGFEGKLCKFKVCPGVEGLPGLWVLRRRNQLWCVLEVVLQGLDLGASSTIGMVFCLYATNFGATGTRCLRWA